MQLVTRTVGKKESTSTLVLDTLLILSGASEVVVGCIVSFLEPTDVRQLSKIAAYERAFDFQKFFCKCGRLYKILPPQEAGNAPVADRVCERKVKDWSVEKHASPWKRDKRFFVIRETQAAFVMEDGQEKVCPKCDACANCGKTYRLRERQQKLANYCGLCKKFWCCEKNLKTLKYDKLRHHRHCAVCDTLHCFRGKYLNAIVWRQPQCCNRWHSLVCEQHTCSYGRPTIECWKCRPSR
jgi:hypothetical protein